MLPGPRHRGSLQCGRYFLALLTGNKEDSKGLMVFGLHQLDQQALCPDGQHTLAFYIRRVPPVGLLPP